MTETEARELAIITESDQQQESFRNIARNVAAYLETLQANGVKGRYALELTAEMQAAYLETIFTIDE